MHRSGTSLCTGVLSHFNADLGSHLLDPNEENPKGFFENTSVLGINKAILHSLNADWDDYQITLKALSQESKETWQERIRQVLQDQFAVGSSIVIKDPRLCLLLPLWLEVLTELDIDTSIVIVHRHPFEVAKSLAKRNEFSIQKGLLLWMHYFLELEYHSRNLPRLFLRYSDDFEDMPDLVSRLKSFTGLAITKKKRQQAIHFFEHELKHQNQSFTNERTYYPPPFTKLLNLIETKPLCDNESFRRTMDECQAEHHQQLSWFHPTEIQASIRKLKSLAPEYTRLEKAHSSQNQKLKKTATELKTVQHEFALSQKELVSIQQKTISIQESFLATQQTLTSSQKKCMELEGANQHLQKTGDVLSEQIAHLQLKTKELLQNIDLMNITQENLAEISRYYRQQIEPLEDALSVKQMNGWNKALLRWLLGEDVLTALRRLLIWQTKLKEIPKDSLEQADMQEYLRMNGDIRRFVEKNPLQSPLWHYIMHGHEEMLKHQREPLAKLQSKTL